MNQLAWRLVFGEAPDGSIANSVTSSSVASSSVASSSVASSSVASGIAKNIDICLYEGNCFNIKELDVLTNHWECSECQQRFIDHDTCNRHIAKNRCPGGQPKLVCPGEKFRHIMNAS